MKTLTQIKKEEVKSMQSKNINKKSSTFRNTQNNKKIQSQKSASITWRNQNINPASTFPSSTTKCTQISNGTSPKSKLNTCKKNSKIVLNPIEPKVIEEDPSYSNESIPKYQDKNDNQIVSPGNPNTNKTFIQQILSMFNNFKPQIDQNIKCKDNSIDIQNQYVKFGIEQFYINSNAELEHNTTYNLNNIELAAKQRKEIYTKYFNFLFNTLEEIKQLCNKQIITSANSNKEIQAKPNNNTLQCDINDSQMKEKSNSIAPVGNNNIIQDSIQSLLISSIYSDFYQTIINKPHNAKHINNNKNNQIEQNILLSTVVKENLALANRLKHENDRPQRHYRKNDYSKAKIHHQQETRIHMNISNESTIKMIEDDDNTNNMIYYNQDMPMPPIIKLPRVIQEKPEHKHTKSIQETFTEKDNCIIY